MPVCLSGASAGTVLSQHVFASLDVALEALRDCWRRRKATMDDLWKAARVCRVANVMKPYMESLA